MSVTSKLGDICSALYWVRVCGICCLFWFKHAGTHRIYCCISRYLDELRTSHLKRVTEQPMSWHSFHRKQIFDSLCPLYLHISPALVIFCSLKWSLSKFPLLSISPCYIVPEVSAEYFSPALLIQPLCLLTPSCFQEERKRKSPLLLKHQNSELWPWPLGHW